MTRREYQAGIPTTLAASITSSDASFTINDYTNWPDGADYDFWVTIDGGTAQEERVLCTSRSAGIVTVATGGRGSDGTTASAHAQGATIWPSWSATDADEANAHINSSSGVHGISGAVVGTTDEQILTYKRLNSPKINEDVVLTATATELNTLDGITASAAELNILDGATLSTTELNYVDGVTSAIQTQFNAIEPFPKGMIVPFAGTSAPTGWLVCDGSAKSRSTYSGLWTALGTTSSPYGQGDGSTTFNLPDLRGRAVIGVGAGTGLTTRSLADTTGVETVTLTSAQSGVPAHKHLNTVSLTDPGHTHTLKDGSDSGTGNYVDSNPTNDSRNYGAVNSNTTGITVSITNVNNTAADAAEAHNNMQPSIALNYIIKY